MSKFPPLHCLTAFEASARHMSFTKAAQELHLSQSAISRQISQLEDFLGRSLFARARGTLQLTAAGLQYAADVRSILNRCNEATSRIMDRDASYSLTVACCPGATFWLPKRIKSFISENPDTRIRILARDDYRSLVSAEYDIGLYRFTHAPEAVHSVRLFAEEVCAVCSPDYLGKQRISPTEMLRHRLLVLDDLERSLMSWELWFRMQGITEPLPAPHLSSNRYSVVLDLAMAGEGIALGWSAILERYLLSGELVKASDGSASLGRAYYACWPLDSSFNPARQRFLDWLSPVVQS